MAKTTLSTLKIRKCQHHATVFASHLDSAATLTVDRSGSSAVHFRVTAIPLPTAVERATVGVLSGKSGDLSCSLKVAVWQFYVRKGQCPCSVDLGGQAPNIRLVSSALVQAGMATDRKAAFQQRLGPPENKYIPKKASLSASG